jgi:hypothetical protein
MQGGILSCLLHGCLLLLLLLLVVTLQGLHQAPACC